MNRDSMGLPISGRFNYIIWCNVNTYIIICLIGIKLSTTAFSDFRNLRVFVAKILLIYSIEILVSVYLKTP